MEVVLFDGKEYALEIEEKSASWGKGVKLYILNQDGSNLNSISYSCHPEFDDFDLYQNKSIKELAEIAIQRLPEDMATENFKLATKEGIALLLPINKV